jgi:hypothetical protein
MVGNYAKGYRRDAGLGLERIEVVGLALGIIQG